MSEIVGQFCLNGYNWINNITTFFSRASFHGEIVFKKFSCKITILPSLKYDYLLNLQDLNKVEVSKLGVVVTNLIGYFKSIFLN